MSFDDERPQDVHLPLVWLAIASNSWSTVGNIGASPNCSRYKKITKKMGKAKLPRLVIMNCTCTTVTLDTTVDVLLMKQTQIVFKKSKNKCVYYNTTKTNQRHQISTNMGSTREGEKRMAQKHLAVRHGNRTEEDGQWRDSVDGPCSQQANGPR